MMKEKRLEKLIKREVRKLHYHPFGAHLSVGIVMFNGDGGLYQEIYHIQPGGEVEMNQYRIETDRYR